MHTHTHVHSNCRTASPFDTIWIFFQMRKEQTTQCYARVCCRNSVFSSVQRYTMAAPHRNRTHQRRSARLTTRSAVPCFPTYSFLPKVETFFIPEKMFVVQTFCLLYLCWQLYSIAPRGGRLGFGCGVSPYLLRSKLLSGGLRR